MKNKSTKRLCHKTHKICYRDEIGAKIALASTNADRHRKSQARERNEKRVYRCPHCYRWHLTSIAQPIR